MNAERELLDLLLTSAAEEGRVTGTYPTRWIQTVHHLGPVDACLRMKEKYADHMSAGFTRLWRCHRPDLTLEHTIWIFRDKKLFDQETIDWALDGLLSIRFDPRASE